LIGESCTQAARRSATRASAIASASASEPAVARMTQASVSSDNPR
jgi:hypothetical protein